MVTIHGRSRQQRYSKLADWEYIYQCARKAPDSLQVLGNGDIFSYLDWNRHKSACPELSTCMIARGALVKVHHAALLLPVIVLDLHLLFFILKIFIIGHA